MAKTITIIVIGILIAGGIYWGFGNYGVGEYLDAPYLISSAPSEREYFSVEEVFVPEKIEYMKYFSYQNEFIAWVYSREQFLAGAQLCQGNIFCFPEFKSGRVNLVYLTESSNESGVRYGLRELAIVDENAEKVDEVGSFIVSSGSLSCSFSGDGKVFVSIESANQMRDKAISSRIMFVMISCIFAAVILGLLKFVLSD